MNPLLDIQLFHPGLTAEWNSFVANSRNGTFQFDRGYMEYHADRFQDCSLLLRRGSEIVALLPANRRNEELVSHGGLSYGGLIVGSSMTTPLMLDCFATCLDWMAAAGIRSWHYKTMPTIYHRHPADEDRYALFRSGASLVRRDVLSVLDLHDHPPFQERRRRGARKAAKAGLRAGPSADWAGFWRVLEGRLADRYDLRPVHTVDEMLLLAARFPEQIQLYTTVGPAGGLLAGTVIYDTGPVVHAQYIAAGDDGLRNGALDLLFTELLDTLYTGRKWFDFGNSNERQGRYLNVGLVEFKEGFGARAVCHDYYELNVDTAQQALAAWREQ